MAEERAEIATSRLILVPALVTFAVTGLRLTGELLHWSPTFFNREVGGGGALVGIVWLIPIFGILFALRLAGAGQAPGNAGPVLGWALAAFALHTIVAVAAFKMGLGLRALATLFAVTSIAALWIAWRGWPALARVMLAYAFSARLPVLIVMLVAIFGEWGTHYDVAPPGFPEMGPLPRFFWIALLPQTTVWIYLTVVGGLLFGGIALALRRLAGRPTVV